MRARAVGSATGVPDRPWLAGRVCAPLSRRHGTAVRASHGTAYPTGFACRGAARQNAVISLSRPTYSASRSCLRPPDDPPARSGPSLVPISDARAKYEPRRRPARRGRAPVGWPGPLPGPCGESTPGGGRGPGTRGPRPAGSPTAHLLRRLRKARAMSPALTFRKRRSARSMSAIEGNPDNICSL
jgi:hypothetical protein